MAQLTNDCFVQGGDTVAIEEALRHFAGNVPPVAECETVPLAQGMGRILAEPLTARIALPPFANSAVDGYAVRSADIPAGGEARLKIIARLQAGTAAREPLPDRCAARIFTGAPMPPEADTVFMQEDCRAEAGEVIVPSGLKPGSNFRPAGEEFAKGAALIPAGRRLRAVDVSLAAAAGHASLNVRRALRAAVFSTGDELAEPGAELETAQIHDSNRIMLKLMLAQLGLSVTDLGILRDEPSAITAAIERASSGHDIVLTSGGVSAGEADYVRASVAALGSLSAWRFSIKPGRPLALGTIKGAAFVGMPGNPVAVYVTFTQIVRGLIAALAGETWSRPLGRLVRADFAYAKKAGRREFVRVCLAPGCDGYPAASRFGREGAGILSSLTETGGLVELSEELTSVKPGALLPFASFAEIE